MSIAEEKINFKEIEEKSNCQVNITHLLIILLN